MVKKKEDGGKPVVEKGEQRTEGGIGSREQFGDRVRGSGDMIDIEGCATGRS